jgi:hypothetical protein
MDAFNEHYVAQLSDAGWSLDHQEYRDGVIRTTWRFTYRTRGYVATMEFGTRSDGQFTGRIHAELNASPPRLQSP